MRIHLQLIPRYLPMTGTDIMLLLNIFQLILIRVQYSYLMLIMMGIWIFMKEYVEGETVYTSIQAIHSLTGLFPDGFPPL